MKKIFVALILALPLILGSCGLFTRIILGVKQPKAVTEKEIQEFAKNKEFSQYPLLTLKDSFYISDSLQRILHLAIPEVRIYDGHGHFLASRSLVTCNNPLNALLEVQKIEDSLTLSEKEKDLQQRLKAFREPGPDLKSYDYVITMNFALWYFPKRTYKHIVEFVNQHPGYDFAILMLNLDVKEDMPEEVQFQFE